MSPTLLRRLGLWHSVGIVIGITIGGGIFRTPAGIATRVPDPLWMLGVWLIGGIIVLCGALAYAELSAAMPDTGGVYVYLREGWGRGPAFLYGWAQLVLIRAAAFGGISTVFGDYCLRSFGVDPIAHAQLSHGIAAAAIVACAIANIVGVRFAASISLLSTFTKFGALTLVVLLAAFIGSNYGATWDHVVAPRAAVDAGLFGLALVSVMWAYDGFADLTFAAGEVKDPAKTLPRAIILGTIAIVAIYVAANLAYLYVLSISGMQKSPLVAADTMAAIVGRGGAGFISVIVMISTFGSLMGSMLATPRVFFAMADDRLFFPVIARVHPQWKTPYVAIGLAASLGVAMVLTQTFERLTDTFVLAAWPFYALGVAAIYPLRRTRADLPRPYKCLGYPVVPAVFVVAAIGLIANALWSDPLWTSVVFAVVLAGLPVYWVMFKNRET
jgi:basic amino acid/polyamine antiporter, APA family